MKEVFVITITYQTGMVACSTEYYTSNNTRTLTGLRLYADLFNTYCQAQEKIKELIDGGDPEWMNQRMYSIEKYFVKA